uniref:MANSC domain-containing protein n=1 Tax=Globodera rostochiensis TaxID=31243 RepID=A0A914HFH1_GLORO
MRFFNIFAQHLAPFSLLITLLQHFWWPHCLGQALCGQLEIHEQKWLAGPAVRRLGNAERSDDLQQCLQRCCKRPDCSAISFSGFLLMVDSDNGTGPSSASCALFQCPSGDADDCALADGTDVADQGLLSVRLRRTDVQQPNSGTAPNDQPTTLSSSTTMPKQTAPNWDKRKHTNLTVNKTSHAAAAVIAEEPGQRHILSLDGDGTSAEEAATGHVPSAVEERTMTTASSAARMPTTTARKRTKSLLDLNTWDERFPLRANATPVWAIGLAIVITVVCLGLLATLLCAFLCYRRHKLRMRTLEFNGPKKMPTLHAFNPT